MQLCRSCDPIFLKRTRQGGGRRDPFHTRRQREEKALCFKTSAGAKPLLEGVRQPREEERLPSSSGPSKGGGEGPKLFTCRKRLRATGG